MGKLVEELIINGDSYKLYDIDEFEKDSTNEYTFDWNYYFDQCLITVNDKPKYLVGLYQEGNIYSEDENYGTAIADLETVYQENDRHISHGYIHYMYIKSDIKEILDFINNCENNSELLYLNKETI